MCCPCAREIDRFARLSLSGEVVRPVSVVPGPWTGMSDPLQSDRLCVFSQCLVASGLLIAIRLPMPMQYDHGMPTFLRERRLSSLQDSIVVLGRRSVVLRPGVYN